MLRRILLLLAVLLVANELWGPPRWRIFASRGIACGWNVVEVHGRLVDERTGDPLPDRAVCVLGSSDSLQDAGLVESFARAAAAKRAGPPGSTHAVEGLWLWAGEVGDTLGLTDAEGRFRVLAEIHHSVAYIGGAPQGPEEPSPEAQLPSLLIEAAPSAPPIVIGPLPKGTLTWLDADRARDVEYRWEIGDIRVRAAPAAAAPVEAGR